MPTEPYLQRLSWQLGERLARAPADFRDRHAAYLRAHQNPDGGWPGREGPSDLYYTGFALRGLTVLGALTTEDAARTHPFLRSALSSQASVVDFFSLLYAALLVQASGGGDVLEGAPADWPDRVAATLEAHHTHDGGYARNPGSVSGSTYTTFLVALAYQLLGRDLPDPDAVARFVAARRRDDGGYVEIGPMRRGGTNPSAAAVGLLQILNGQPGSPSRLAADTPGITAFLLAMQSPAEGGFRANARAPLADLLSSFTAGWTLDQLGAFGQVAPGPLGRFAAGLELPDGGFRGGLWDDGHDVEYTFYGLGVAALLSPEAPGEDSP